MKNYNINFNYLLAPAIIAFSSHYIFNSKSSFSSTKSELQQNNSRSIPIDQTKDILLNNIKNIKKDNKEYTNKIIINRHILCNLEKAGIPNAEKIYTYTLLINDKLDCLLDLLIEHIKWIYWFKDENELKNIYKTIETMESNEKISLKSILIKLNYNPDEVANIDHKNEFIRLSNYFLDNFNKYYENQNKIFDNFQTKINTHNNDIEYLNKTIRLSVNEYYININNSFQKLKDIINTLEWVDYNLL